MTLLTTESDLVNNEALGAAVIWKFAEGAQTGIHISLCFLCLPILFHEQTRVSLNSTQKRMGLRGFISKFETAKKIKDLKLQRTDLLGISERAKSMKERTKDSISMAIATGLIELCSTTGTLSANKFPEPTLLGDQSRSMLRNAVKLGSWCSDLEPITVFDHLKVEL